MSQELQANTIVKVRIGPAVAVGDGFTPVANLVIGNADEAELLKHNGVATVDISGSTMAAVSGCDGWYDLTLSGTDTNTEGLLDVVINDDSLCLPIHARFMVLAQAAWLSKYTAKDSGLLGVDVVNIAGSTVSTSSAQLGVNVVSEDNIDFGAAKKTSLSAATPTVTVGTNNDKTGYTLTNLSDANAGKLEDMLDATGGVTLTANLTGAITGNLSGSVGSVTGAVGSVAGNVDGSVASVTAGVSLANDAITSAKYDESSAFPVKSTDSGATQIARVGADSDTLETLSDQVDGVSASAIADAVWNELSTGHVSAGKAGQQLWTDMDAILVDTATLPSFPQKNVALTAFTFFMVLATDHITAATGKTITAQISKDGGAFANCNQSVAEISNGFYKITLTSTEMNAVVVALKFTNTDCDTQALTIVTSA